MWEYKRHFKGAICVWTLLMSAAVPGLCEEGPPVTKPTPDCANDDCNPTNATSFTPPPADSMSRLMPTSQHVLSNDTKDPSASNIDIVTTPDTSLGLGAFSPFAAADRPSADQQNFSPSPFLGVISEAHISNYGQSVAVGEVFPDSIGDRHLGGHKYLYSIAGQRAPHTGHSYHNEQRTRPTQLSPVDSLEGFGSNGGADKQPTFRTTSETLRPTSETHYSSLTFGPHKDSSLTGSTKSLGYPVFEIPDRFKEFKDVSNAITDYKPPPPVAFPSYDKPIKEDLFEDRPDAFPSGGPGGPGGFGGPGGGFGGPGGGFGGLGGGFGAPDAFAGSELPVGGPGLPPPPAFTSPPAFYKKPPLGYYGKGGKWGGIFKVLASLIPLGVLLAAFSPSLLVVNATEDPAPLVEPPSAQTQVQSQAQTQALSQAQSQTQALTMPQLPPHVQVVSQPQLTSGGSAEWTKIPTWSPTVATGKTPYRSLESTSGYERSLGSSDWGSNVTPPQIPAGLQMTSCHKRKVCEALTGVDDSYKPFVDSLVYRVGGGFKEIADLALAAKCAEIPCVT